MPWMIEAAILLCAIVGDWVDFAIILGLLVGNTVIACVEEWAAGDAVAALKAKLALATLVKRDGQWQNLPALQLVPGDRVRLAIGAVGPADNRWFTRLVVAASVIDTQNALNPAEPELSAPGGARP